METNKLLVVLTWKLFTNVFGLDSCWEIVSYIYIVKLSSAIDAPCPLAVFNPPENDFTQLQHKNVILIINGTIQQVRNTNTIIK